MVAVEQYLKPELAAQIKRLDLRAQIGCAWLSAGVCMRVPIHGFSVEFSEHRRYAAGDDPKDIDWVAYAKTGKYYVKKFESETNLTGYLAIDLSQSMDYTYRQQLTKLDYSICLAAALSYLMIQQQDPVGLVTFDTHLKASVPPRSRRSQLPTILSQLKEIQPTLSPPNSAPNTDLAALRPTHSTTPSDAHLRPSHTLVYALASEQHLLTDEPNMMKALRNLRHSGHDLIIFHVLDEAEVTFPFNGNLELVDPETVIDRWSTRPTRRVTTASTWMKCASDSTKS